MFSDRIHFFPISNRIKIQVAPLNHVNWTILQKPGEGINFLVGLRAPCRMTGLPRVGGNRAGTAQGTMKRNVFIYARVLSSVPPIINGIRPPDRTPATPMDTPEPGRTEDMRVVDRGYDLEARVTVQEDRPRNVTVLGWFGKTDVEPL